MYYEPQRLSGSTVPLSVAAAQHQRTNDVDPAALWHAFVGTLVRRRMLFAAVFLGVVATVALVTLLSPKKYTADVKLIAGNPAGVAASNGQAVQTGLPVLNALMLANSAQSAETYAELLGETPVVQHVIRDLGLKTSAQALAGAVSIKPVTNTNVLSLAVTWSDPAMAAKIANDFASVFMMREAELVAGQADGALDFLTKQLPIAERKLRDADTAVSRFEASHNIADLPTQTQTTVAAAASIDAKINQIQLEKQQADAEVSSLSSQLARMTPSSAGGQSVTQNPVREQLRTQLAALEMQLSSARQQFTDANPTVIRLISAIADLKRQIAKQPATIVATTSTIANPVYQQLSQQLAGARATSASDDAQLRVLTTQRAAVDPKLAALPVDSARLADLQRRQKLAADVYNALQQKYNDATVSRTTTLSDITITQPADAAMATKTPRVGLNLMIGAIAGLLLALGIVFLVDWFDGRIRDEQDVESELGLPVLASIPQLPGSGGAAAAVPATMRDAFYESYFQLVLAMRYSSDRPLRTVAVTSPLKGDGKSTVAANIARAFGEIAVSSIEREERVLIIDADLRRPSLHKQFGIPNTLGVSDILVDRATLAECVRRTDRPGVDVLTCGTHSPNPIKLLESHRFDALLREARERYVTVIVDAPALVPVFDAAIVAAKTDGTVMILSAGSTDVRSTRKALARLDAVGVKNLVGAVVNRSSAKIEDYSDYFAVAGQPPKELAATTA